MIPKIGVDSEILEGDTLDILNKKEGVWREPDSSTPENIGNMVIAGHRFQYLPPNTNTFYNLDKLNVNDIIVIYWQKDSKIQDFIYKIYDIKEVNPNQTEIRNFDKNLNGQLTLYTCGPNVGEKDKRIVIKAKLI